MEKEEIKVGMSLEDVKKEQLEPGMVFGDEKYDCMQIILKIGKKIKFIKIKKNEQSLPFVDFDDYKKEYNNKGLIYLCNVSKMFFEMIEDYKESNFYRLSNDKIVYIQENKFYYGFYYSNGKVGFNVEGFRKGDDIYYTLKDKFYKNSKPCEKEEFEEKFKSKDLFFKEGKNKGVASIILLDLIENHDKELHFDNILFNNKQKSLSSEELYQKAKENENLHPQKIEKTVSVYERNEYIAKYAKRRAEGKCQLCKQAAPFIDKDGEPYLESHHIVWLSKGGADSIENTVALCPNCHRKIHILNDEKDVEKLKEVNQNQKL